MTLTSLVESILLSGIALLLLTTVSLGAGLLLVRLLRKRVDNTTRTWFLRALLSATLLGIIVAFIPLPRPEVIPSLPVVSPAPRKPPVPPSPPPLTPGLLPSIGDIIRPVDDSTPLADTSSVRVPPVAVGIASVWLLGVVFLIFRLVMGYVYAIRLLKRAPAISPFSPLGGIYMAPFASARRCPVKIITVDSDDIFMVDLPLLPPLLALPREVDTRFERPALDAILSHERSHLERYDGWWNLAGQVLCCLLWCQPLAWFLLRTMERNSEAACDEAALAHSNCSARVYAETLLRFAESPQRVRQPLTQSLRGITWLLSPSFLEERICVLMNHTSQSGLPRISQPFRVVVALCLVALPSVGAVAFGVRNNDAPIPLRASSSNQVGYADCATQISIPISDPAVVRRMREMFQLQRNLIKQAAQSQPANGSNAGPARLPLLDSLGSFSAGDQRYRYEVAGTGMRIITTPTDKNGLPRMPITGTFKSGTVRGILEAILHGTGFTVRAPLDLRLQKSFTVENARISEVIPALLQLYPEPLHWEVIDGEIHVQRHMERNKESNTPDERLAKLLERRMNVPQYTTPIRTLIHGLLHWGGITNYTIEDTVTGTVTVGPSGKGKDMPIREILDDALRQTNPPAHLSIKDGLITISTQR